MSRGTSDAERFDELYRAHQAAVRFVARRIDPSGAEEVVAETFAVAWRKLHEIPADALPWLYVVARNKLRSEHRAARSRRDVAENVAAVIGSSMDPADVASERDRVLTAFAALSETDREALRLTGWDGLDHRRAAVVCGTSRVAFSMRLSRARRRLAAELDRLDGGTQTTPSPTRTTQEFRS